MARVEESILRRKRLWSVWQVTPVAREEWEHCKSKNILLDGLRRKGFDPIIRFQVRL